MKITIEKTINTLPELDIIGVQRESDDPRSKFVANFNKLAINARQRKRLAETLKHPLLPEIEMTANFLETVHHYPPIGEHANLHIPETHLALAVTIHELLGPNLGVNGKRIYYDDDTWEALQQSPDHLTLLSKLGSAREQDDREKAQRALALYDLGEFCLRAFEYKHPETISTELAQTAA